MSIRHESDTVLGTVVYCDKCGKRGAWTAYDNVQDTLDCAELDGWQADGENDLCADCKEEPSV